MEYNKKINLKQLWKSLSRQKNPKRSQNNRDRGFFQRGLEAFSILKTARNWCFKFFDNEL